MRRAARQWAPSSAARCSLRLASSNSSSSASSSLLTSSCRAAPSLSRCGSAARLSSLAGLLGRSRGPSRRPYTTSAPPNAKARSKELKESAAKAAFRSAVVIATVSTGVYAYFLFRKHETLHAAELSQFQQPPNPPQLPTTPTEIAQAKAAAATTGPDPAAPPAIPAVPARGKKQRIVILGSGWAALSLLRELDTSLYEVILVSPRNYFLFTPLLPSVTVGTLEPRSVVESIRKYCKRTGSQENVSFFNARCTNIDAKNNTITCSVSGDPTLTPFAIPYDYLVVAVGSANATFGTPGVEENCYFLKELDDAQGIRERIMSNFEIASLPCQTVEEVKRLLHFVVVGGGPTGVEFAAELYDFLEEDLKKWFPAELVKHVKITIIQSAEHILNTYDAHISAYAEKKFARDEIELKTNCRVTKVGELEVAVNDKTTKKNFTIPYGLCVWATGVGPWPLVRKFCESVSAQTNARGVLTDKFLLAKGTTNVFALGDCSTIEQQRLLAKIEDFYVEADTNKDGYLSYDELAALVEKHKDDYPQLAIYALKLKELFAEMDINNDQKLDKEEFRKLVALVDSNLRDLPPTAQVARQQGTYLGRAFNARARSQPVEPFHYRHLGSFAYIGARSAVLELPGGFSFGGFLTWFMWRSAYMSGQISWRNRFMLAADWSKELLFGRDISKTS